MGCRLRLVTLAAFVICLLAGIVVGIAHPVATLSTPDRVMQPDHREPLAADPRVRVVPQDSVVGLNNTTSMAVMTFNPDGNNRSVDVEIRVWVTNVADVNLHVNGNKPKSRVDGHRGWRIVRSLEPDEYRDESLEVMEYSKSGQYVVNVDIEFIRDGRRIIRSDKAFVHVTDSGSSISSTEATIHRLRENAHTCLGGVGQCVEDNPNKSSALIGVLTFVSGVLLSDQFRGLVRRDWRS